VTPRCGKIRVPHWYHPPGIFDHHWEPETEWHRNWKNLFPMECQEVCHRTENGERHLADVKTAHGQVLEFQNSPISDPERASREAIYGLMCWVVNGLRLKNDRAKFIETLRLGVVVHENPLTIVVPTASSMLLRKWESSQKLVVFDFGEPEEPTDPVKFGVPVLWTARPGQQKGETVLMPIYRARFVDAMVKGGDLVGVKSVRPPVCVPAPSWMRPRRRRF
jgi:competence protein CoiA